ncbi:RES family NAD+ phosphorylase [Roseomonas sp. JC162]|uniref:RES family NAD+ phosphorylase n=1 Tax=Neoroseomonas marina TaxID=1232220 RepID=A0A848EAH6_9PROT|nr:RES family NAD+ phosphorylase [Neoroseomonas marina]
MTPEALVEAPQPAWRLIPSRFPPIAAFDTVATPGDLEAVMELEGWTNDRLVAERIARLPREQWVYGTPNASVVMASFLHAAPAGSRFNGPELGGWYAAAALPTAIAEVAHHLRREARARGRTEERRTFRCYTCRLIGRDYRDLRGQQELRPDLYASTSYAASQVFGEAVRASAQSGIVYDSLRHRGGTNVVAFRPRQILDVVQTGHYDLIVPVEGRIIARTLRAAV